MSMCSRVFFCVVGRRCLPWSVCSLGKTLLAFAMLHFVLQGQICLLLQYLLTSYFCIPVPYNEKDIFFGVSFRRSHRYSCLENPMDRGAWKAAVHGVAKSVTRLSDFTFTFHFHALEKEMAIHSSVLAWRISGMGEPGGLPFMGSHRVGHDWRDLAAAAAVA